MKVGLEAAMPIPLNANNMNKLYVMRIYPFSEAIASMWESLPPWSANIQRLVHGIIMDRRCEVDVWDWSPDTIDMISPCTYKH